MLGIVLLSSIFWDASLELQMHDAFFVVPVVQVGVALLLLLIGLAVLMRR